MSPLGFATFNSIYHWIPHICPVQGAFFMQATVFIDESGDTGWTFSKPYQKGGSSRYFTIAYIIVPSWGVNELPRLVRKIYKKYSLSLKIEKKGASFSPQHAQYVAYRIVEKLLKKEGFQMGAITIDKENAPPRLREDSNVLYNYALVKALAPKIQNLEMARVIPDKRTVKIVNGDTLDHYLRIRLHAEMGSNIQLIYEPRISNNEKSLWLIDWVANFAWRHYENDCSLAFNALSPEADFEELFF